MKHFSLKDLTLNAIFGSIYFVLVIVQPMSSDVIQFRIAEILLVFVIFNKKISPGILLGTFLANIIGPFGLIDAIFGTIASFLAILLIIIFRKRAYLAVAAPAITNGIIIGLLITYISKNPFYLNFIGVFIGEFVVMYLLGLPIYYYFKRSDHLIELIS